MTDEVDRAQELEQQQRDEAIRRARIAASFTPRDPSVETECIDCAGEIEPERLRVLKTTARCAECAQLLEQKHRGTAWARS